MNEAAFWESPLPFASGLKDNDHKNQATVILRQRQTDLMRTSVSQNGTRVAVVTFGGSASKPEFSLSNGEGVQGIGRRGTSSNRSARQGYGVGPGLHSQPWLR